jgi:hypothetical protein
VRPQLLWLSTPVTTNAVVPTRPCPQASPPRKQRGIYSDLTSSLADATRGPAHQHSFVVPTGASIVKGGAISGVVASPGAMHSPPPRGVPFAYAFKASPARKLVQPASPVPAEGDAAVGEHAGVPPRALEPKV